MARRRRWTIGVVTAAGAVVVAGLFFFGPLAGGTADRLPNAATVDVPAAVPHNPNANQYPLIEEDSFELEEIATASFEVFGPARIPATLRLLEAGYLTSAQRHLEEADCGKVVLFYADPVRMSTYNGTGVHPPYLQLDLVDVDCTSDDYRDREARAEKGAGPAVRVVVGENEGTIAEFFHPDAGKGFFVQLTVQGTDVFVDSTLSRAELVEAIRALVPFDPSAQPIWPPGAHAPSDAAIE